MRYTRFNFGVYLAISLTFLAVVASSAQAQVEKSGKATYSSSWSIDIIVQRFPDNEFAVGGVLNGIRVRDDGKEFMGTLKFMCSVGELINDIAVGDWQRRVMGCIYNDADGDIIFTKTECRFDTYEQGCDGLISGGTGKYAGITGKSKVLFEGDLFFRRSCVSAVNPSDCLPLYPSALSVPLGVTYRLVGEGTSRAEMEWRIP